MSSSTDGPEKRDSPFLSHPDQDGGPVIENGATLLREHLRDVATAASTAAPASLATVAEYAGLFHDFGKATHYFQEYLIGERTQSRETNHADISALAAYYALTGVLDETERLNIFFAIHHHHQNLDGASARVIEEKLITHSNKTSTHDLLVAKAESLRANATQLQALYDELLPEVEFSVTEFCDWVCDAGYSAIAFEELDQFTIADLHGDAALDTAIVYSSLRAGDIQVTAGHETRSRVNLYEGAVTDHIDQLENTADTATTYDDIRSDRSVGEPGEIRSNASVTELRGTARREIQHRVENAPTATHFFDIRLPTGLGKTLSGIEAATRLRRQKRNETGTPPRIVYAMPQTAIIDQNHDVLKNALRTGVGGDSNRDASDGDLTPRHLLKHHHLSDETHLTSDRSYGDYRDEKHLTNQWDSEVITTTFVQLIESLTVPAKKQTHRIASLENAVIVLDEVQALPPKYWELISETLEHYATQLDWDVITMTATDPKVTPNSHSLIDRVNQYYNAASRVDYNITPSVRRTNAVEWDVDDVAEFAVEQFTTHNVESVLCIQNTISDAKSLHEAVKSRVLDHGEPVELVYLSSNLPPRVRRERINKLTDEESTTVKTIVVSTQVVEAGVDLSTDCVIREIAPLDSIVQAAGRCNRNGERETGIVHIVSTGTDVSTETLLYGAAPIDHTRAVLLDQENPVISDTELTTTLLPRYYSKLKESKITSTGVEALHEWRFCDAAIRLIDTPTSVDVFIERTREDSRVREAYESASDNEDWERVEALKPAFQDRVVSLNIYHDESDGVAVKEQLRPLCDDPSEEIVVLDVTDPRYDEWYDTETGVKIPGDTASGRVI